MFKTAIAVLCLQAPVWAQQKTNFSGVWVMDKARSKAPSSGYEQTIEHKDPVLVIRGVTRNGRQEWESTLRLTTDGKENVNVVNNNEFHARSRWEEGRLVTLINGDKGLSMTEIRKVSADGKTLTIEQYMGEAAQGEPQTRMILVKKEGSGLKPAPQDH